MLRYILRLIFKVLFRLLTRYEVVGLEKLPTSGGCLLCANHLSIVDAPLLFVILPRQDTTAFVADKHRKNPFLRTLVNAVHGIWLNREEADFHAFRLAREHLQGGGVLGIAPEGTRSKTGALAAAKTGVAYIADKAGVPVIPVAIAGTDRAFSELKRLRRPRITATFGDGFSLPPIGRAERDQAMQRNTDEIMCRIAVMLPERHRGVYADHPRLKELLKARV